MSINGTTGLAVCLECYHLRSTSREGTRRCPCTPRDKAIPAGKRGTGNGRPDLCHLCARDTVTVGTRWSSYGCEQCRDVNKAIGNVLGGSVGGALTLGGHSLQNGVALGGGDISEEAIDRFADRILALLSGWRRLETWCRDEARRLADSAALTGERRKTVALSRWKKLFPVGAGPSVDAFVRYSGSELPDHPSLDRLRQSWLGHLREK